MSLPQPSQVSVEFNLRWATENADLFVKRIREFGENHPASEWNYTCSYSRGGGFVTYTAKRKEA